MDSTEERHFQRWFGYKLSRLGRVDRETLESKEFTMMPITVLYHANCPDGFGAALACWQRFGDAAQYIPVNYGQSIPTITAHHMVYIVDFSYPVDVLRALLASRQMPIGPNGEASVIVLDHHVSAQRDLEALHGEAYQGMSVIFDLYESGATLTHKYLRTGGWAPRLDPESQGLEHSMPLFFKYLRDRDLWQWQLPDSHAVSLYVWSQPRTFEAWNTLYHGFNDTTFFVEVVERGKSIKAYADTLVKQQVRQAVEKRIGHYTVPVVNATCLFSEVGDYLCTHGIQGQDDTPLPSFVAYYMDRKDGKRQWGLRSRGGFDCSLIAKLYGGGGHPGAAGFVTEQSWCGE